MSFYTIARISAQVLLCAVFTINAFAGKPGGGTSTTIKTTADGVVLIDMAAVAAGGVTPEDTPGFPVTISESGPYRLSENLTVPDANTSAIDITASSVDLDLNGFTIQGPNQCPQRGVCNLSGAGIGVKSAWNINGITVRNGAIKGMGAHATELGSYARVKNVDVNNNGGRGIKTRHLSTVEGCTSSNNFSHGIEVWPGSIVKRNVSQYNGGYGVFSADLGGSLLLDDIFNGNSSGAYPSGFVQGGTNICNASVGLVCQ